MEKTRYHKLAIIGMIALMSMPALVAAQTAEIPFHAAPYFWSSRLHAGSGAAAILAENHRVTAAGAPWLRLHFNAANLGEKSYLMITSLQDGYWQRLDATSLAQWQNTSAYFNGGAVDVQLHVAPNDEGIFVELKELVVGEWVGGIPTPLSQCGPVDDRVPSNHPASGRILSIGCTGWIVANDPNLHVTAGHCSGGSPVLQFNVPPSNPNGSLNNPPPQDQYAVDPSSWNFVNGGIGNDWGVFKVFPNSVTGLLPSQAQGAAFNVKQDLDDPTIRITGFGVDFNDPTRNQTQQTHAGPNVGSSGTTMRYQADTEGGNSGSPVIDDATGMAVGVHTHGGCSTGGGGNNSGTSTFNTAFWNALNPVSGPFAARINAGGANFTDGGGNLYVADRAYTSGSFGFVGGTATTFSNAIGGTTDDPLYQAVRRAGGASSFSYRFDVPSSGNYAVTLHLMAPAIGAGNFVMDVLAEGNTVFNNLDINAEAGSTFQALIKTFSTSVNDGTLDLDFVTVNKQAIVSAIAVLEQTGTPEPEIDVSPSSVNFGNVTVGQNANQNVTINNVGTATLTVSALNITNSVFSLVSPPSLPLNIPPSGSQVLTVRFSPVAAGAQSGNLAISSNDADEPTVNVSLSGTGVTPSLYTARINSGGPNFTTGGGTLFVADQAYNPPSASFGFVGGVSGTNSSAIGNTTDDPLYQAFRRSTTTAGASFQYNFNVPSGTYSVTLHLAAPNAGGAGSFVMTVQAEGANVPSLTNFDINAQAGGTNTALSVSFSQVVTDGTLNLNFVRVNKASIVSGIEVVQTAGPSVSKSGASNVAALAKAPAGFKLHPNHPNPFNPATRIRYEIPRDMPVTLKIYNLIGEEIRGLVSSYQAAGSYEVEWDGRLNSGTRAPSGVYFYRLQGEGFVEVKRMLLLQ